MDAFGVLDEVLTDYESFGKGFLDIKNDQIRSKVLGEIDDGLLWPEPWLALNPAFEPGGSVGDLVARDVLGCDFNFELRQHLGADRESRQW